MRTERQLAFVALVLVACKKAPDPAEPGLRRCEELVARQDFENALSACTAAYNASNVSMAGRAALAKMADLKGPALRQLEARKQKEAEARAAEERAAAAAAAPAPPGIGVTQQALRSVFEPKGFVFEPGVEQIIGKHGSGMAILQLLGPAADLKSAGLMGSAITQAHAAQLFLFSLDLMKHAMPQWEGAQDWVVNVLGKYKDAHVRKGDVEASVEFHPELGEMINVTVRRADAPRGKRKK